MNRILGLYEHFTSGKEVMSIILILQRNGKGNDNENIDDKKNGNGNEDAVDDNKEEN